jgi:hypothetical protein
MPVGGLDGGPSTLLDAQIGYYLAVDSANVYWNSQGSALSVPLGGGAVTTLAAGSGFGNGGLALANGTVYWTTQGSLCALPAAGGLVTTLVSTASWSGTPTQIAADAANVYFYSRAGVQQVPVGGGGVVALTSNAYAGNGVAVDASNVYFTGVAYGNEGVFFMPIGGGTVTTLAVDDESPTNIAVDANAVYWTDSNASFPAIMKVAKP